MGHLDFIKIGERLKNERKKNKLSQPGLSEKLEKNYGYIITRQAISEIEKGRSTKAFTIDLIDILCDLYGCDASYLLCEFSDCTTHDNQFIHDTTGLSDESIKVLQSHLKTASLNVQEYNWARNGLMALNDLLCDDPYFFINVLSKIGDYAAWMNKYESIDWQKNRTAKNEALNNAKLSKSDAEAEFRQCINDIYEKSKKSKLPKN